MMASRTTAYAFQVHRIVLLLTDHWRDSLESHALTLGANANPFHSYLASCTLHNGRKNDELDVITINRYLRSLSLHKAREEFRDSLRGVKRSQVRNILIRSQNGNTALRRHTKSLVELAVTLMVRLIIGKDLVVVP